MTLFTPEEVAERLNVQSRTVRDWLRSGKMRGVKAGRLWRIEETAFKEFLKDNHYLGNPEDQSTRIKLFRLSDEDNQRVLELGMEHLRLAKEASKIPVWSPEKAERVAEINRKIEELRKERDRIINGGDSE